MNGRSKIPCSPSLTRMDLMMVLPVIVHLIHIPVIIMLATSGDQIQYSGAIRTVSIFVRVGSPVPNFFGRSVKRHLRHAIPSLLRAFVPQHRGVGHLTRLPLVAQSQLHAGQLASRPVHVSIGQNPRGPSLHVETSTQLAGGPFKHASLRSK